MNYERDATIVEAAFYVASQNVMNLKPQDLYHWDYTGDHGEFDCYEFERSLENLFRNDAVECDNNEPDCKVPKSNLGHRSWNEKLKCDNYVFFDFISRGWDIYHSLLREAERSINNKSRLDDVLVISEIGLTDYYNSHEASFTRFTKASLADWFFMAGHIDQARLILPTYTPEVLRLDSLNKANKSAKEEIKALRTKLDKKDKANTHPRESVKPYQLIAQLIKIILPATDLTKPYQVHDALSRKLGRDELAVSQQTLKNYLEKHQ